MNIGDDVRNTVSQHQASLMVRANVVGVSHVLHDKLRGGRPTGQPSVRVYVKRKVASASLRPEDVIPAELNGVPTDVIAIGEVRTQPMLAPSIRRGLAAKQQILGNYIARVRPLVPGYSIGHYLITAGTLGAIGWNTTYNHPVVISNNHVLANARTVQHPERANLYDDILQPGPYDGGQPPRDAPWISNDLAAFLWWWSTLDEQAENTADLAYAGIWLSGDVPLPFLPSVPQVGWVKGRREVELDLPLQKTGRTSGHTVGKVADPAATIQVAGYGDATLTFSDVYLTEPMSAPGDSGSLMLTDDDLAVGFLFAGSINVTVGIKVAYLPPEIVLVAAA